MLGFRSRKLIGQTVDRGRGRRDHFLDLGRDRRFQHVERAVRQHLQGQPRLFGALRDADGGLVEDDVDSPHGLRQRGGVANIPVDDPDEARRQCPFQVLHSAAHEVVDDDDLAGAPRDQLIRDMRADQARAASNENAFTLKFHALSSAPGR